MAFHPDRQEFQKPGHRRWAHNIFDDNAYAVIGVPQDATQSEVRAAYRRLVQKYHPDAVTPEEKARAVCAFVQIDKAYDLLNDPDLRKRYDAWIETMRGGEPPLDEVWHLLKNEAERARFDPELAEKLARPAPHAEAIRPEPIPEIASEPAMELEMPDAVREALGLPIPTKSFCQKCGQMLRNEQCPQCEPTQ